MNIINLFSGTGNSLVVARDIAEKINGKIIPIVSMLDQKIINTNADVIGFVFPIHYMAIPTPVKYFIKKLELDLTKYIFAIATRLGSPHTAFTDIDKILQKKGRHLDSHFALTMAKK